MIAFTLGFILALLVYAALAAIIWGVFAVGARQDPRGDEPEGLGGVHGQPDCTFRERNDA